LGLSLARGLRAAGIDLLAGLHGKRVLEPLLHHLVSVAQHLLLIELHVAPVGRRGSLPEISPDLLRCTGVVDLLH
jgi:hypothetical protein